MELSGPKVAKAFLPLSTFILNKLATGYPDYRAVSNEDRRMFCMSSRRFGNENETLFVVLDRESGLVGFIQTDVIHVCFFLLAFVRLSDIPGCRPKHGGG